MAHIEYFISKLSFQENQKLIESVFVYKYEGENLTIAGTKNRNWLLFTHSQNYKISTIFKNSNFGWSRGSQINKINNLFSWDRTLPINNDRRKTFISYYHKEDQNYKEKFNNIFEDLITHKSVEDGDINSDHSDGYIKQLIQKDYLNDTTVLVVLIGPNTKHRKHIDWEISGALNLKVGDKYSGLLGLLLPSHPNFGSEKATYDLMPSRLADNFRSKYAIIRDWTDDRVKMQEYIELAFEKRNTHSDNIDNTRKQMTVNTNE
ncbi:TIR domain-containing protein [Sphingobacterium kitahiroshimense]|uniref:TIR domain-containing protein n=1 Tax=Sphingobacterium kitahiroshimense TaxID=470446 RepID=UPI003209F8A7